MNTPRRRLFQFSLRTLLVLTVIVSLGMGWLMKERRRIAARREALIEAGWEWDNFPKQPGWHRMLYGDDEPAFVYSLGIGDSNATDAELVHLTGLTQLKNLSLRKAQITDAGLTRLKGLGLTQLIMLHLDNTPITDAGLVHLTGLTQLRHLGLNNTQITDAGLVHLTGLTQLQSLGLNNTQITDAGLVHLTRLSQLQELGLESTKITDSGLATFRNALPKCSVIR